MSSGANGADGYNVKEGGAQARATQPQLRLTSAASGCGPCSPDGRWTGILDAGWHHRGAEMDVESITGSLTARRPSQLRVAAKSWIEGIAARQEGCLGQRKSPQAANYTFCKADLLTVVALCSRRTKVSELSVR